MRRTLADDKAGGVFRFSPRANRAAEIKWRPWGREAFDEAEREGKLILLSISATWCHWCHVMDETTYSDPEIIERINRDFIPVRVDSDMRPDINKRYNQGGWPTTAFLIYTGRPLAGLTYAPAAQLSGILKKLSEVYRENRGDIDSDAELGAIEERKAIADLESGRKTRPEPAVLTMVEAAILKAWDRGFGGLGEQPKFPQPATIEFALERFAESEDGSMRSYAVSSLDGMMNGGLLDKVEGGFFRYATRTDWSVPHYEKMLSDNAALITAYLQGAGLFEREDYAQAARSSLDYALVNLLDDERRGFYGSQDADEEYYLRSLEARKKTPAPAVDRTIYTDSSSRMISALALASFSLDDPGLLTIAERCADFLWRQGFRHDLGACHYFELESEEPRLFDQPADQAWLLKAVADLYQATGDAMYLERAAAVADVMLERFVRASGSLGEPDEAAAEPEETLEGAALADVPDALPDVEVNGVAARALLTLDSLMPEKGYAEAAERIIAALSGTADRFGYFATELALALDAWSRGIIEVRLNPEADAATRAEMLSEAMTSFSSRKAIRPETVEDFMPTTDGEAGPAAVVCSEARCTPARMPGDVRKAIDDLLKAAR